MERPAIDDHIARVDAHDDRPLALEALRVEAVRGGVFGKQVADVRVDAEEIADGVLVLAAIEATEDDLAAGEIGPGERASKPLEEGVALPGRRLFLFGRGHLPEADAIV